jgi:hypothetical protein
MQRLQIPVSFDVPDPFRTGWVRVVDDKSLLGAQARFEESLFTVTGLQQIEADADVGREKSLLEKR